MSTTVAVSPVSHTVPSGNTAPTPTTSTITAVLSDASDATYIYPNASTNRVAMAIDDLGLPAGSVINWIRVVHRQQYNWYYGYWRVEKITATKAGAQKSTATNSNAPGGYASWGTIYEYTSSSYQTANDGTRWEDCDSGSFEVYLDWQGGWSSQFGNTTNAARVYELELEVNYDGPPVVTPGGPTGVQTSPTPSVTWGVDQSQVGYQIIVVESTDTDDSADSPGDPTFDPSEVADPNWDSGTVLSSTTTVPVGEALTEGPTYYAYVRAQADVTGWSDWETAGSFTIDIENITAPSIVVVEDDGSYSISVTVQKGTPGGGETQADEIEVQQYNETTGAWETMVGATGLTGSGAYELFDSNLAPGSTGQYRARGKWTRTSDGILIYSAWQTASQALTHRWEWWLKYPPAPGWSREIEVTDWSETETRPQNVMQPLGGDRAVVTHSGQRRPQGQFTCRVWDEAAFTELIRLFRSGHTLVLVTIDGEARRIQTGDVEIARVRAQRVSGGSPIGVIRLLTVPWVEVV